MKLWHITPDQALIWRDIRLEMLQDAPEAFGSRYEDWFDAPLSRFRNRLDESRHFAAGEVQDVPLAVACWQAGITQETRCGWIMSVYTRPTARGRGYAEAVLNAIAEDARAHGMTSLGLHVVKTNYAAQSLYRHLGYVDSGIQGLVNAMGSPENRLFLSI